MLRNALLLLAASVLLFLQVASAQDRPRVGVVLSGGGARGAAHVGFLKALEEEGIPVDCRVGTSIGALVGGYYAAGWSPEAMLSALESGVFEQRLQGGESHYAFKTSSDTPAIVELRLSSANGMVRSNWVRSLEFEWSIMEELGPAGAACAGDFDQLFVPFRCIGSDVLAKQDTVFSKGNLSTSVRASVAFPFYLPPVWMDGRPIYDGGLYNNVPVDAMEVEFAPDIILVSAVQSDAVDFSSDDLMSQVEALIVRDEYERNVSAPVVSFRPEFSTNTLDFAEYDEAVRAGYEEVKSMLDTMVLAPLRGAADAAETARRREAFTASLPAFSLGQVEVIGLEAESKRYASEVLGNQLEDGMPRLKRNLFLLDSDGHIGRIEPTAQWNDSTQAFDLQLAIEPERDVRLEVGGSVPSNGSGFGHAGVEWQHLGSRPVRVQGQLAFGSFYSAARASLRSDFHVELPFAIEAYVQQSRFSYQRSVSTFFSELSPVYLRKDDAEAGIKWMSPTGTGGLLTVEWLRLSTTDQSYGDWLFDPADTADTHGFEGTVAAMSWEYDTRNSKQCPRDGSMFEVRVQRFAGVEDARYRQPVDGAWTDASRERGFLRLRARGMAFIPSIIDRLAVGFTGELSLSDELIRSTYRGSLAQAMAYQPMLGSKVLFLENFRAYNFAAVGTLLDFTLWKNGFIRAEVHGFQPFESIVSDEKGPRLGQNPPIRWMAGARLHSELGIGPVSLGLEYYQRERNPWFFELHWGFRIFQPTARR